MSTYLSTYQAFESGGEIYVALRCNVSTARRCCNCTECNISGQQHLCNTAKTLIETRIRSSVEPLEEHYRRAIANGNLHRCYGRLYSMTPVNDNGTPVKPADYYAIPKCDYLLKAVDCPCGAYRQTVVRHVVQPVVRTGFMFI